ncbi:MAG: hypothetical protein R3C28_06980 [Pirellulaceae bacterium]
MVKTYFGDANLDREFNSSDLVTVFESGLYETGTLASWSSGDWNGDGEFNSADFVVAFEDGGYEQGPRNVVTVPEPHANWLVVVGLFAILLQLRNCQQRSCFLARSCHPPITFRD